MSMMQGKFVSFTLVTQIDHLSPQSLTPIQIPLASLNLTQLIICLRLACCVRCES